MDRYPSPPHTPVGTRAMSSSRDSSIHGDNKSGDGILDSSSHTDLSRQASQTSIAGPRASKKKWRTLSRNSSLNSSERSLRSAGSRWTATLVFMAMEIRMIMDMAELMSKNKNFTPSSNKNSIEEAPDESKDDDSPTTRCGVEPSSSPPPSPPPYDTVIMDENVDESDYPYTGTNTNSKQNAESINRETLIPKNCSIELHVFDETPATHSSGTKYGKRNEDANGRVTEVGIVVPSRAENSCGDGDRGDGSKSLCNDTPKLTNEKTPLHSPDYDVKREHWDKKMDFLLSIIGYAVDLANVWRFPYLCYKNGGGAFLVPYFSVLIFGAMPVFFMELSLGQFHRQGPITVWKMAPLFKGIGMASCFMAYIVAFYYNVIIGWSFYYLFSSFTSSLPWTSCENDWNSGRCWESDFSLNSTNRTFNKNTSVTSTLEFFERGVLSVHKSPGLHDVGHVRWQLVLCTLLTFSVLYFCLWKGVKSTGKVVYVTAIMPYVILTILLVRGVMLPGAGEGIRFFITPDLNKLGNPQVWIDAAVQIFFSVGAGFGTHIAYASYNKFNNNCQRDCIITVIVNSFTSIFSGFVIFSYLGYMSSKTHKHISQVATEGPGLVFNVYPEAIATLPGSTGWAIIFFFMLLTLGIDSAFGGLESPLTGLRDEFKSLMKYRYFREALTLVVVGSAFLCSLPCLTEGGIYVFTILDTFAAGTSILFTVLCQVVAVAWFYGINQFCQDIERMIGSKPSIYWRICWKFVCPILLTIIVISSIVSYVPLSYTTADGTYVYPFYANVLGWCIAMSSMLLIPGYAVYKLLKTSGSLKERVALCISPEWEHEEIRQKKYVRRYHKEHWLAI